MSSVTGLSGPTLNDKELRRQQRRLKAMELRGLVPPQEGQPRPSLPIR